MAPATRTGPAKYDAERPAHGGVIPPEMQEVVHGENDPMVTRPWAPRFAEEGATLDPAGRPRGRMFQGAPRPAPSNSLQHEEPRPGRKPNVCR
jgi:hypothetical protein